MIRHCLDVMHIKKNFFNNIFNYIDACWKGNQGARRDLQDLSIRGALHPVRNEIPLASYMLSDRLIYALLEWLKILRFPDANVSNRARNINMTKHSLFGM